MKLNFDPIELIGQYYFDENGYETGIIIDIKKLDDIKYSVYTINNENKPNEYITTPNNLNQIYNYNQNKLKDLFNSTSIEDKKKIQTQKIDNTFKKEIHDPFFIANTMFDHDNTNDNNNINTITNEDDIYSAMYEPNNQRRF